MCVPVSVCVFDSRVKERIKDTSLVLGPYSKYFCLFRSRIRFRPFLSFQNKERKMKGGEYEWQQDIECECVMASKDEKK